MKAVVFTLGCKVNECESDSLIALLSDRGYTVSDKLEKADIYFVNTCAVTAEAEKKSRQAYARIRKLNADAKIVFMGCACQKNPQAFSTKDEKVLVCGTFHKDKIADFLDKSGVNIFPETREYEEYYPVKTLRTRAFIKVQDGCDNFCSYCIIPYLRGRSRSRAPQNVAEEIKSLAPKEAVINGINLSSYDYKGEKLPDLIKSLFGVDARIRLGSLEARVITAELLSALKDLKNFAPHFHLSLQSGSDAVLKKMNRKYTAAEFIEKADLIREFFPDAGITTDIIAGFPTETEEDFADTLKLVDRVNFSDIHPFIFSPREGTAAYKMPDLPYQVKKARLDLLLDKKAKLKRAFAEKMVGKTLDFLFEEKVDGYAAGYSGNYLRLFIKDYSGEESIKKVKVLSAYGGGAIAELVKE